MITKRQREILIGTLLGDGYLQSTGKRNARLRLEHSEKQRDYLWWKYENLQNLMQDEPKLIERYNPQWRQTYRYYRCQSHAMPLLGKYKRLFYEEQTRRKRVPENLERLLKSPLTLAVWYMDDGHYYPRDRVAYLYLPKYTEEELARMVDVIERNFELHARIIRKKGYPVLFFSPTETERLLTIIRPHIHSSMAYKIPLDPVTTEGAMPESLDSET
jgi:hypothetical protein